MSNLNQSTMNHLTNFLLKIALKALLASHFLFLFTAPLIFALIVGDLFGYSDAKIILGLIIGTFASILIATTTNKFMDWIEDTEIDIENILLK